MVPVHREVIGIDAVHADQQDVGPTGGAPWLVSRCEGLSHELEASAGTGEAHESDRADSRESAEPSATPLPRGPPADPDRPSIYAALQEQLGLKLDAQRGAVDVLVVDAIQRPTED